jgi:FAD binding domain/Berberine and berberine like
MAAPTLATGLTDELAAGFRGTLLRPGDDGYEQARLVWNGLIDRRPALIARCAGAADVIAAVRFARETALPVSVRGGGHSALGYSTCDDGIVIDLSQMRAIRVDPEARTARAEGGATWADFDAETSAFGLAVTGGRFSTTGIAGLTLGSGSGWLERRCGLTPDNLIAADVVLADGRLVTASEESHPELFWGLRGGGGNFGVVTSFVYQLHEIGPMIYGGMLVCAPDRGPEIMRFLREHMPTAPDDLGLALAFVSAPPEPHVPPEMHFKPVTGIVVCWSGPLDQGEAALAPLRAAARPLMDMVGPMPYPALQSMLDGSGPKGSRAYMKAEFIPELTDAVIEKLARHGGARPGPMCNLLLEPMGGQIARMHPEATSIGRRDAAWCYHALSLWMDPDPQVEAAHVAWAKELAADLAPHTTSGVYLNFTSDAGDERVRASFGAKYDRLVAIKDRYDPANMFRLNSNIRPSNTVAGPV